MTSLISWLTVPPGRGDIVCPICKSWRNSEFPLCHACTQAREQLPTIVPVLPMTLYAKPSQLRDALTYYKPGRGPVVAAYEQELRHVVRRFLGAWGTALAEDYGPFDLAVPVPASHSTGGALERVFGDAVGEIAQVRHALKFAADARPEAANFNPGWFVLQEPVENLRVMLFDDVYTSGSRAQSAATRLSLAGASVAVISVIARRINPGFSSEASALWQRQRQIPYDFTTRPYWR